MACLRQLAQREAREVCEYALTLAGETKEAKDHPAITETGLEGALFGLLDTEGDRKLISDVQDTLVSMLQALAADNLTRWLLLIKDVLQVRTGQPQRVGMVGVGWYGGDFAHILQGYFCGTGTIVWLLQCQWSNPEGYG